MSPCACPDMCTAVCVRDVDRLDECECRFGCRCVISFRVFCVLCSHSGVGWGVEWSSVASRVRVLRAAVRLGLCRVLFAAVWSLRSDGGRRASGEVSGLRFHIGGVGTEVQWGAACGAALWAG